MKPSSDLFQEFAQSIGGRDPKIVTAYLSVLRDFIGWLATRPGSIPFRVELPTKTAIRSYLDDLKASGRAPRTRTKAIGAISCFCR
jgi:hypothetical protein